MNNKYKVINSVEKINELHEQLSITLKDKLPFTETREITYPSGRKTHKVHFETDATNTKSRAYTAWQGHKNNLNLLLFATFKNNTGIEISVQLNFPKNEYSKRLAGVFIEDEVGGYHIAHRGQLTKGKGALKKTSVLNEFKEKIINVEDNGKGTPLIYLAKLDSNNLVDDLWNFAENARTVADKLGEERALGLSAKTNPKNVQNSVSNLKKYFDEFAGESTYKGSDGGTRNVEHGFVVKALKNHLNKSELVSKSQAIDLFVMESSKISLYEVKTDSKSTSIYTGTGQLFLHGEILKNKFTLHTIERYLVIPTLPNKCYLDGIKALKLIKIVTFKKHKQSYKFTFEE